MTGTGNAVHTVIQLFKGGSLKGKFFLPQHIDKMKGSFMFKYGQALLKTADIFTVRRRANPAAMRINEKTLAALLYQRQSFMKGPRLIIGIFQLQLSACIQIGTAGFCPYRCQSLRKFAGLLKTAVMQQLTFGSVIAKAVCFFYNIAAAAVITDFFIGTGPDIGAVLTDNTPFVLPLHKKTAAYRANFIINAGYCYHSVSCQRAPAVLIADQPEAFRQAMHLFINHRHYCTAVKITDAHAAVLFQQQILPAGNSNFFIGNG